MKVAKVIGNIWATRKEDKLEGLKLLVLQPINLLKSFPEGSPIIAADIIDAGVGETVIYVQGSSARGAAGSREIPVDATVVAIVDGSDIDESLLD
ncbi:ethanolamine utilization protein EutN [Acetitomaculum ruminis DSM 5522]|uniref:Ethanolamine utilization protein EutN n=1 Tax=Acetitomaculum ruminis DSM 5522 TaxID=1120918 RepID=A0A1I0ZT57_9FIRM|nr:EutN/CcmL family microcompartment protein [Acetitomaculum ruminis]SFB28845.1 ethanolamine utilization protein EutN [Acetitomaculum ruminis DSM 5522]